MDTNETCAEMKSTEPQEEHRWLQQLLGDWTFRGEAVMEPGKPGDRFEGNESVRALGDLWTIAEGQGEMCGGMAKTVMILGFNPQSRRFVGTFVASMMTHLWVYKGELLGNTLTLETEGPDHAGKMVKFRDIIEVQSPDHRTLSSHMLGEDGEWRKIMEATYLRRT